MSIGFGVKEEGRDEVEGENGRKEGGVNVPVGEKSLELSINLLENGGRVGHCCGGEICMICLWSSSC